MPEPASNAHAKTDDELLRRALAARESAYAPYSSYRVGAAVRGASGAIYTGCNVENASYGLTICAERAAVAQAILAGERRLTALAIVADGSGPEGTPPTPCGACRQILREFAADMPILCATSTGETRRFTLSELLPHAFGPEMFREPPR